MLNIKQDYLAGIPKVPAELHNGKMVIIIHNTATVNATAKDENVYFHREWANLETFVHAFVDWNGDVYEHAPFGVQVWGAGNVNKHAFLQVEQCISTDDEYNQKSADYTAQYVARKIKESGKTFDDFLIMSHAEASNTFGGSDHQDTIMGLTWDEFITKVKGYMSVEKSTVKVGDTFRCNYRIKVRTDGPDTINRHVHTFNIGDVVVYDRRLKANGYEWISQKRTDGTYWYIPVRALTETTYWGEI